MKKLWLRENYIMPTDLHLFFFAGKKELTVPKAQSFSYSRAQILMLACGTKASATFKKNCVMHKCYCNIKFVELICIITLWVSCEPH